MIEGWRGTSAPRDRTDWREEESALEPVTSPGVNWPAVVSGAVVALMIVWIGLVIFAASRSARPSSPEALLLPFALACVPLVLGALLLLLIRQSEAATRRRLATGEKLVVDAVRRLDRARAQFADNVERDCRTADEQTSRWHMLADGLTERTAGLSRQLSEDLLALDGRLERVDAAAAGARRDLTAVLAGLPNVERQTRELVGSLREAGLTAHEGAGALDAQLGLLRHRAAEADEAASAATARLTAQLERMETIGGATAEQLAGAAEGAARAHDALMERADQALDRSAAVLAEHTGAMTGSFEEAERRLGELAERSGAQLSAQLDLLDERTRGSREAITAARDALVEVVQRLDGRLREAGERIAATVDRGTAGIETFDVGLQRLTITADSLAGRIGVGEEAMSFTIGRAESLLTALDAAARELDETLPASFGRFERSAGEGFQRLSDAMPALERYHALTDQASNQLAGLDERLGSMVAALEGRLSASDVAVAALAVRIDEVGGILTAAGDERLPQLLDALQAAQEIAANLGALAAQTIDEALPSARQRLIEAVSQPVADAVDQRARESAQRASTVAADALNSVEDATARLDEMLDRVASTERVLSERSDSVLALAADENEASFSRRVALLIEALNSTAVDVGKLLSNEVSDTAWAAYLKGDRAVFTRRAVRLLDTGEAREVLRAYEEDGEFRDQVNRYVHDFEALLRTVLADANGSVLAVTLLSSDTGKLYVALAQAIERLRG